jgi:peptidoglycan hydrolase-like protein with peptidoglycan-binding domain
LSTRVNPTHNYLITFMTIAKDFASKAGIAFVALAMIFTMSVPASNAQTQTPEDLQKMIDTLMAQIEALKGGTASATASGYTWTRDLKTGATGADVMELQKFLNSNEDTRVAATGVGSAGMETSYFGPATAAAVSKFQMKYRADILSPAGLVNPTGFFGPSTRAKANALNTVTTPTPEEDEDEDTTDEDEDTDELSGEGSLDSFEIEDASDTDVQEGAEDAEIAVLTLEATDGDIEVDRMDLTIAAVDGDNTENDPWEVFEEITLWVDGEKVAEFDASDEDNYLDEDDGTFRFTNLELVLREDEEVEVTVAATVNSSVDDAGVVNEADWTVAVDEVRYFDADGVAENDDSTGDMKTGAADSAAFEIVVEGDGEELTFGTASTNPDATDIVVDTDSKTTGVTIMEYNIEAEEGDIELNTLFVKVTTATTSSLVIDDIALEIDGQTFDAENSASTTGTVTTFEFDIDGDVTVEEGDEITVAVVVDLKSQESATNVDRYANGTTIEADVTGTEVDLTDAEGSDDLGTGALTGSANGESHTLVAEGIVVPVDSVEATTDTSGDNDTLGEFTIEFDVTAVEGDFYITDDATKGTSTQVSAGVAFTYQGDNASSTGDTVSGTLTSTADEETDGVFTVREGETETFTLRVTVDAAVGGDYRVTLEEVNFSADEDGTSSIQSYILTPAQDFRTGYETIQTS